MDPYEVLGVPAGSSTDELRRAYLRLARANHPDYFVDAPAEARLAAEERMRAINDAWAAVGDPTRRRAFDDERPQPFRAFSTDDDPDPREAPDIPYRPAAAPSNRQRTLTVVPALALGGSVIGGAVGTFMNIPGVLALAVALFLVSCVGFVIAPLVALTRARRDEG